MIKWFRIFKKKWKINNRFDEVGLRVRCDTIINLSLYKPSDWSVREAITSLSYNSGSHWLHPVYINVAIKSTNRIVIELNGFPIDYDPDIKMLYELLLSVIEYNYHQLEYYSVHEKKNIAEFINKLKIILIFYDTTT